MQEKHAIRGHISDRIIGWERTFKRTIHVGRLMYREASHGKYADLRDIEVRLPRRRFLRVSVNGQYRVTRSKIRATRYGNPGWDVGVENAYFNWTHFRRHVWHACVTIRRRGVTLSWGRRLF